MIPQFTEYNIGVKNTLKSEIFSLSLSLVRFVLFSFSELKELQSEHGFTPGPQPFLPDALFLDARLRRRHVLILR
jgi:hypothetical protein